MGVIFASISIILEIILIAIFGFVYHELSKQNNNSSGRYLTLFIIGSEVFILINTVLTYFNII